MVQLWDVSLGIVFTYLGRDIGGGLIYAVAVYPAQAGNIVTYSYQFYTEITGL